MWAIPTGTSSGLKKKTGKESQYMVSYPELSLDPPIGSDWESERDSSTVPDLQYIQVGRRYTVIFVANTTRVG